MTLFRVLFDISAKDLAISPISLLRRLGPVFLAP